MGRGISLSGGTLALLVFSVLGVSPTLASPQSQALIAEGVGDMTAQQFSAAYTKFVLAEKTDPKDSDAVYFTGVALNRLRKWKLAYQHLAYAEKAGSKQPDLDLEIGRSLVFMGYAQAAVERLSRYDSLHPGAALTQGLLGHAWLELGKYDQAEAAFRFSMKDPALKPSALLYLAIIAHRRGDAATANSDLQSALNDNPASAFSQSLRQVLAKGAVATNPWHASAAVGIGYNDNIVALGNGVALPGNISHQGAAYEELSFDSGYRFDLGSETNSLTLGYGMDATVYDGLSQFDLFDNYFHADYLHVFAPDLYGSFKLADEPTWIGGDFFRNQVELRPALAWRANPWLAVEGTYDVAFAKYEFPLPPVDDRSGTVQTVALTAYLTDPQSDWTGKLGYYFSANDSKGADFDSLTNGIFAAASHPLFYDITGEIALAFAAADYSHPNSFSFTGSKRNDDITQLTVQLLRPIAPDYGVYLRYQYLDNDSNISFFSYRQNVISVGLTAHL
jgi:tetratricopeptide (TPR) repeat protein